jgi:hypothetical protein
VFWKITSDVSSYDELGGNNIKIVACAMMINIRYLIVSKEEGGEVIDSGN